MYTNTIFNTRTDTHTDIYLYVYVCMCACAKGSLVGFNDTSTHLGFLMLYPVYRYICCIYDL